MDTGSLVGRGVELSLLDGLVAGLSQGAGGAVLIDGEQGIGKTSLLRASLAGAAAAGCQVCWGTADELLRQFPLRLMIDCLGDAVAAPSSPGPSFGDDPVVAEMERLLAAVDRLAAASPVVLVAEDLQWADEASVLMWYRLSRAAAQMPLLLAGSARISSGRPDLDQLWRGVRSRGGVVLTLEALPDDDVDRLVANLLGGRPGPRLAKVTARASGNPLYIRELADSLFRGGLLTAHAGECEVTDPVAATRLPVSLAAAIADRIALLDTATMDALRWAAVLGHEFSALDLAAVLDRPADEMVAVVGTATAAGLLASDDLGLRFRHEVIRQALYEKIPATLRVLLHVQAAQALAVSGAAPERIAAQLVAGPGESTALPTMPGSAREWATSWLADNAFLLIHRAPEAAAMLLRDELALLPDNDERRVWLQANLVRVAFQLARNDEAERVGSQLLDRTDDPDLAPEMAWLVSYSQLRDGRPGDAMATLTLGLAKGGMSDLCQARLRALHAVILSTTGELDAAEDAAQPALALARKAADPVGAGYALHTMAVVALIRRDNVRGVTLCDEALAEIGDHPLTSHLHCLLLSNKAGALADLDRFKEALSAAREEVVLAERAVALRLPGARFRLATLHHFAGEWDDALAELQPTAGIAGFDYQPQLVNSLRAVIAAHRDDRPVVLALLSELPDQPLRTADVGATVSAHWNCLARAMLAEQDHGPAAAAALLAPCLEPHVRSLPSDMSVVLPMLVRLAIAAGDDALAAEAARVAQVERAADGAGPLMAALADHCCGLAGGDPDPVLAAASYLGATGRPLLAAQAREDAAVLLAQRGDDSAARQELTAACRKYTGLGADWDLRRATARLRPFGIRPRPSSARPRPATGWGALTPTELRVSESVAQGRSNPDIAAELLMSRNTVQTHVSHILAKLGAQSRAEIIAEAFRQRQLAPAAGLGEARPRS